MVIHKVKIISNFNHPLASKHNTEVNWRHRLGCDYGAITISTLKKLLVNRHDNEVK
ncbi:MAG: hypothetical protein ACFFG0_17015 [Candidatus Thorarchaeota archaeon]